MIRLFFRKRISHNGNGLNEPEAYEYKFFKHFAKLPQKFDSLLDLKEFSIELFSYILILLRICFGRFESSKSVFVAILYRQRGKNAKRFVHSGMAALTAFGVMIAPVIAQEFPGQRVNPWEVATSSSVLSASIEETGIQTDVSAKPRDKIIEYTIAEGDTVSSIAEKFGISTDTVLWQNNLGKTDKIKPGQSLEILPATGVSHKVAKGDTVYSVAKKYDSSEQSMVDFPYNAFVNDETFELAIGQILIVPDGVKPSERPAAPRIRQLTPDAGTVVASGTFVWPASGIISQYYSWYHPGSDIANRSAPDILAADAGTIVVAGWPDNYGYGIIDHGNGYRTLYGHMSKIYVVSGQTVARGDAIGKMGSTGRSTGIHLHFEVVKNGTHINPLSVLR